MPLDQPLQGQIRQHVAVVDQKRLVPHEIADIGKASRRVEEHGFVPVMNGIFAIVGPEQTGVSLRPVMGVDHEVVHAERAQVIKGKGDERLVEDRHQRLRPFRGERAQSRAQAGAEDECRPDLCAHTQGLSTSFTSSKYTSPPGGTVKLNCRRDVVASFKSCNSLFSKTTRKSFFTSAH